MIRNNFAVFILSHGRANNLKTLDTIQRCGYTGRYYIILDDEDSTIKEYINNFGENHIIVFNKQYYVDNIDEMDNFYNHYACVYARNACFDIAKDLGLTYFLELDDDYREIWYRFPNGKKLGCKIPKCLDDIFEAYLDFLDDTNATSVAMCQGGDLIGGITNKFVSDKLKRKTMNSWFCRVTDRINFIGTMNDDVNTYLINGQYGKLFLTPYQMQINQPATQEGSGGMVDIYKSLGTYVKSFYTVMLLPSCVKIAIIGTSYPRVHYNVNWETCVPMIINENYKKL